MAQETDTHFLDGRGARIVAGAVLVFSLGMIGFLGRENFMPAAEETVQSTGNPELDACLQERVGAVDQMRADGVINAGQYEQFRGRAVAFCEWQFGGAPQNSPIN